MQTCVSSPVQSASSFLLVHQSVGDTLSSVTTGQPTISVPLKHKPSTRGRKPARPVFGSHLTGDKSRMIKRSKLKKSNKPVSKFVKRIQKQETLQEHKGKHLTQGRGQPTTTLIPLNTGQSNSYTDIPLPTVPGIPSAVSVVCTEDSSVNREKDLEDEEVDIEFDSDDDLQPPPSVVPLSGDVYQQLLQTSDVKPALGADLGENPPPQVSDTPNDVTDMGEQLQPSEALGEDLSIELSSELSRREEEKEESLCQEEQEEDLAEKTVVLEFWMMPPQQEVVLSPSAPTEEEQTVHKEFFDGRPPKTPERYLKIRNYIVESWLKSKPNFLNKTKIRSGLKNCGDVNCIGRIHSYLEWIGAINFGCDQAVYNNPSKYSLSTTKHRAKKETSTVRNENLLPRKRRIKDEYGDWVDPKQLEGKTINHEVKKEVKVAKTKVKKIQYDPFKLVPCADFSEEHQAPYKVAMMNTALAVMDIHSHICKTEVIGLVGGRFDVAQGCLTINMAVPCRSLSTGMQCEMDPVSQTLASEQISQSGLSVVGWYHSHPTFRPDPSVRDIETQLKLQDWFSKGGNHFVGVIISPYNPRNPSVSSSVQCLTVSHLHSAEFLTNIPYKFVYQVIYQSDLSVVEKCAVELSREYCDYINRVRLSSQYVGVSCLHKMVQSVRHKLSPHQARVRETYASGSEISAATSLSSLSNDKFSQLDGKGVTELEEGRPSSVANSLSDQTSDMTDTNEVVISDFVTWLENLFTDKFVSK